MRQHGACRWTWALGFCLAALGCDDEAQPPQPAPTAPAASTQFDAAKSGSVAGRVTWDGDVPLVPPFEIPAFIPSNEPGRERLIRDNPNAPRVEPKTRGVAGAVVFLRGVPLERSRPWDHPPARVELDERGLVVVQGAQRGRVGFVRRGDAVETVSRESRYHVLRGTGASFFSFTLPDPDKPRRRVLTQTGVVELTSGAGHFWMRGYLFVGEHPYCTQTDAEGRFRLEQVPPGRYRLVCSMPSWVRERQDRDPETNLVTRYYFRAPVEQECEIEVHRGVAAEASFTRSTNEFNR